MICINKLQLSVFQLTYILPSFDHNHFNKEKRVLIINQYITQGDSNLTLQNHSKIIKIGIKEDKTFIKEKINNNKIKK